MDKLKQIKQILKRKKIHGIALDIDETLSATFRNWVERLLEEHNDEGLTTEEMMAKYRYFRDVPYWQNGPALNKAIEMMEEDKFQENIPLLDNSNHMVEQINKVIPIAAYITARPEKVVPGTIKWLIKHGFPKAAIFSRPKERTDGHRWKGEVLKYMYPHILGIIDDDPKLPANMPKNYKGTVFVYNLPDFDTSKYKFKIIPCGKWDDVYERIKNTFNPESGS